MISLNDVSYSAEGRELVRHIQLGVEPGELVVLAGPNGAGKTTLFNLIAGEYKPSAGTLLIDGKPRESWVGKRLADKLAILPQQSQLNFPFPGRDVVEMGRLNKATSSQQNRDIVEAALAITDTISLADIAYTRLSGGEKQRIQLARILVQIWEPATEGERYLLLDEPTSALDLSHQHSLLRHIRELTEAGVGILMVLHDLNLAARYADKIVLMEQGAIAASGTPWQVLTSENIRQVFNIEYEVMAHPTGGHPLLYCC